MNKKLTLSIATPCHEDWNKMSDDAKGKFCGACQKEVIDFTKMSESQLVAFFRKPAGSVCGRFRVDQLDQQMNIPKKRIPWIKYFFTISLPAFLFSMKSNAQIKGDTTATVYIPQAPKRMILGKVAKGPEEIAVTGRVSDENGNAIPHATVMVKNSKIGVAADENGFFSFKAALNYPFILEASAVGFKKGELEKTSPDSAVISLVQDIALEEIVINGRNNLVMLGGITAGISCPENEDAVTQKITDTDEDVTTHATTFKVYPNPVRRGKSFTVAAGKMSRGEYKVNIADMSGKIIQTREVVVRDGSAFSFSLGNVASGIYIVSFTGKKDGVVSSQKLVVK